MSGDEKKKAIVAYLQDRDVYVPISELAPWMKRELHLSRGHAGLLLRSLLDEGRITRRATRPEAPVFKRYEYTAVRS